jgi:hypothetical protein
LMMETWKKHTWKMVQKLAQSKVHLETNIHFHAIMFRNHTKFVFAQHMQKPFHIQNWHIIFGFLLHKKFDFLVGCHLFMVLNILLQLWLDPIGNYRTHKFVVVDFRCFYSSFVCAHYCVNSIGCFRLGFMFIANELCFGLEMRCHLRLFMLFSLCVCE